MNSAIFRKADHHSYVHHVHTLHAMISDDVHWNCSNNGSPIENNDVDSS
jgi:hypothetical protein